MLMVEVVTCSESVGEEHEIRIGQAPSDPLARSVVGQMAGVVVVAECDFRKYFTPLFILYKCIEANVPIKEMLSRMYSTHYICIVAKLKL